VGVSTAIDAVDWQLGLDPRVKARSVEAISRCERLPVMDRSVQRVLALTEDDEAELSDLVSALEADPALTANVLRYANSAFVNRPLRAKTVRQAVTMVGRRVTRQLCLEAVTFRFFESAPGNGRLSRGQLHIHAVSVANAAAAVARLVGIPPEGPHLAGLLHDCGKLVMPLAFGEDVLDEIAAANPSGVARSETEWDRLGVDHAYAGALFAEQSGLAEELVAAIAWHHGGRRGFIAPSVEVACLQLANTVVGMLNGGAPDPTLLEETLQQLGLQSDALDVLAENVTGSAPGAADGLGERVLELERLASTDELTGLANRRGWMASVKAAIRDRKTGSVLLCDLDDFKAVNDTYGHSAGDLVLTEVARILDRHGDAGRLGGDEFAVWVPGDAPAAVAERIVAEVLDRFSAPGQLAVGVSVGVAPSAGDLAAALEQADRALYAAKASGRGRACHAHELASRPASVAPPC
jgi:diguanylate cyclase (GGDEF)-like protein/putative nucleotidyltransferase with HDIG domain